MWKVQATDREGRLSMVTFRGELLSFSSLSDLTAASRAQFALKQSTDAIVVEELHTFVIQWLPLSAEPKLLGWCFYTNDHDGMNHNNKRIFH